MDLTSRPLQLDDGTFSVRHAPGGAIVGWVWRRHAKPPTEEVWVLVASGETTFQTPGPTNPTESLVINYEGDMDHLTPSGFASWVEARMPANVTLTTAVHSVAGLS